MSPNFAPIDAIASAAREARAGANCWIVHFEDVGRAFEAGLELAKSIVFGDDVGTLLSGSAQDHHAEQGSTIQHRPLDCIHIIGKDGTNVPVSALRDYAYASYTDTKDDYKIYIIKDAGLVSAAGFDVLLKPMEESSPKVVWIVCAANLAALRPTIISRCRKLYVNFGPAPDLDVSYRKHIINMPKLQSVLDCMQLADDVLSFAQQAAERELADSALKKQAAMTAELGDRPKLSASFERDIKKELELDKSLQRKIVQKWIDTILKDVALLWRDMLLVACGVDAESSVLRTPTMPGFEQSGGVMRQTAKPTAGQMSLQTSHILAILRACLAARQELTTNASFKMILLKLMLSVLMD